MHHFDVHYCQEINIRNGKSFVMAKRLGQWAQGFDSFYTNKSQEKFKGDILWRRKSLLENTGHGWNLRICAVGRLCECILTAQEWGGVLLSNAFPVGQQIQTCKCRRNYWIWVGSYTLKCGQLIYWNVNEMWCARWEYLSHDSTWHVECRAKSDILQPAIST